MYDPDRAEIKKEKKQKKVLMKSVMAIGLGLGLWIMKILVAPHLGVNEQAEEAVKIAAWCLMAYGIIMVLCYAFRRNWFLRLNIAMSWVILPLVFLKLLIYAL